MAFERHIANYSEPPSSRVYYSVRTANKFPNKNGRDFEPNSKHKTVWMCLLMVAYDLSKSVTHTWVGKETLKQMAGMSRTMFSEILDELQGVGFVTVTPRMNTTNQINIHVVPVKRGQEKDQVAEPVSVAPDDMGIYVCQAARARVESASGVQTSGGIDEVLEVVTLLEYFFPEHPSFKTDRQRAALSRHAAGWIRVAGSGIGCHAALKAVFSDESEAGFALYDHVGTSDSFGAYITTAFPSWWATFSGQQPDAEVIAAL